MRFYSKKLQNIFKLIKFRFATKVSSHRQTKNINLLIWGCNEFSEHLYTLLETNGVNILGFIDPELASKNFCNKPVYDPETFKTKSELASTPIIIASPHIMTRHGPRVDFESIRQFKIHFLE